MPLPMPRRLLAAATLASAVALPAPALAATTDPAGAGCDRLDDAACLLPFPNDAFTRADRGAATGRRLAFRVHQMPRNASATPIDPAPLNAFDGFSPGSVVLTKVPGLDTPAALRRTRAASLSDISRYTRRDAPVLVVDAKTGRRHPIWVELNMLAERPRDRLLSIHPARNFAEGRRYVVILRDLRDAAGHRIGAGRRFAALRSGHVRTRRYDAIFRTLRRAGVARDRRLFLAWDFTVASERSLSERMLRIRDDAFGQLGDRRLGDGRVQGDPPAFTLAERPLTGPDAGLAERWARVVEGTVEVPCYLDQPGCGPGSRFNLGRGGLPVQLPGNVMRAHFTCVVPRAATADAPARLSLYGHGLLGSDREVLSNRGLPQMAQDHDIVFCATPWAGMSSEDIPNAVSVLQELGRMPTIADRLQQGMLNALVLGRLMIHPRGLAAHPLLRSGGRPIVHAGRLFYDGNSQGGIMGGALTALAPDFRRAALGVPAMNYSVLLPRSVDFDTYSAVMYPAYPDVLERPLLLDLIQLSWDRGEADGYAHHMTRDPLPDTPSHEVLLHVALGDHQVSQYQADVEARTIGARIHRPAFAPGRSLQRRPAWGIPALPARPYAGSAIVYWDSGPQVTGPPPLENVPNRVGRDPHEDPRQTPAAQRQKSLFLRPEGRVVDVCGGAPCVARPPG
jgi:hypothetical protein